MTYLAACVRVAVLAALTLGGSLSAVAESNDETTVQHVLAEGIGRSADEAQKDAWRNAVSQVVGAMVDTETLIKNDKIINDQVLTYSRGYIDRFTVISQTTAGGLFRLRIEAWVKRTEVREKLTSVQVLQIATDGGSIAAQIKTRQDLAKNASGFVAKALEPFVRAQHVKIVDVTQGPIDVSGDGASIAYRVRIGIDDELFQRFRQELVDVLAKVGRSAELILPNDVIRSTPNLFRDIVRETIATPTGREENFIRAASWLRVVIQSGGEIDSYILEPGTFPRGWVQALARTLGVKVRVRLFDSRNAVVALSPWACLPTYDANYPRVNGCTQAGVEPSEREEREVLGRIGVLESWEDRERSQLLVGITNLIRNGLTPAHERAATGPTGQARGSLTLELKVALDGDQARRVVRAEAQIAPFPEISLE